MPGLRVSNSENRRRVHFSTGALQTVLNITPGDVFWKKILLSFKSTVSRFLAESGIFLLLEEPHYSLKQMKAFPASPPTHNSLTIEQEKVRVS